MNISDPTIGDLIDEIRNSIAGFGSLIREFSAALSNWIMTTKASNILLSIISIALVLGILSLLTESGRSCRELFRALRQRTIKQAGLELEVVGVPFLTIGLSGLWLFGTGTLTGILWGVFSSVLLVGGVTLLTVGYVLFKRNLKKPGKAEAEPRTDNSQA